MHWTAGGHRANGTDKRAYHYIIEGDGSIVKGNNPPEANRVIITPSDGSTYAAHTRGLNTGSIGVAVAAMRGAREVPFDAGPSPITDAQVAALVKHVAALADKYGIPVTRECVLTHAEVQPTLGVWQRQKWDIMWLPGMTKPTDPVAVGDMLRTQIRDALQARHMTPVTPRPVADSPAPKTNHNGWGAMFGRLLAWLGGRA